MAKWLNSLLVRLRCERGEIFAEYTVLVAVMVLLVLGAVQYFFGGISALFTRLGGVLRDL